MYINLSVREVKEVSKTDKQLKKVERRCTRAGHNITNEIQFQQCLMNIICRSRGGMMFLVPYISLSQCEVGDNPLRGQP